MRKKSGVQLCARVATLALIAVLGAACSGGGSSSSSDKTTTTSTASATPPERENVTFYYQQLHAQRDLSRLGKVNIVVAAAQTDGPAAAQLIKSTGAKAYRYMQAYWLPTSGYTDDPEASSHRDWYFCSEGDTPAVGRTDRQGRDWYFYDMNERASLEHLQQRLQAVKAEGWDGVFFDRGHAALTGLDDPSYQNVWDQVSTCTTDPVKKGATFADAYTGATREAHAAGLQIMMNYGGSPFDADTPLRPDSKNKACQQREYADCPTLDDAWPGLDWVLDEAIAHQKDELWAADYRANRLNEQDPEHGGQTVGLLTTGSLGVNNRDNVFYEWSRVKLFKIPLAVNTGEGGCQGATVGVCNRARLYPDLANIGFGNPIDKEPVALHCQPGSKINCVWVRHYDHGMSVVNVSDQEITPVLNLKVSGCRIVTNVWSRQPLNGGTCVTKVPVRLPPWSGRPLVYAPAPTP